MLASCVAIAWVSAPALGFGPSAQDSKDDAPSDATSAKAPTTLPAAARVLITEIMYNPASEEARGQSEWVEIANLGSMAVEMVNWRLEDEDTRPADRWGPFSCTLLPGQVAVLINGDAVTEEEFRRAWDEPASSGEAGAGSAGGSPYLVIPVKWGNLANTPSTTNEILALRDGESNVVCEVNFESGNGWPRITGVGGPSIYLIDLDAMELSDGSLWRASIDGEDGARLVRATETFTGADIGSPGRLPARKPAASAAQTPVPAASAAPTQESSPVTATPAADRAG